MEKQYEKYYKLFTNYIKYNKLKRYPPFLSKIMKIYTTEEARANLSKKKCFNDMLKFAEGLKIRTVEQNKKTLS